MSIHINPNLQASSKLITTLKIRNIGLIRIDTIFLKISLLLLKEKNDMDFIESMQKDFADWKKSGTCNQAKNLNDKIGEEYFDTATPHYFVGNPDSDFVLVHLNPKRNKTAWKQSCNYSIFNEYFEFHKEFGKRVYGKKSDRKHKSPFDRKQIRFIKPFGVIDFTSDDEYKNLENVIDQKYQLELIPYGSPSFDYHTVYPTFLESFIKNVLNEIARTERKYVIFCGKVFKQLLIPYIGKQEKHSFKLKKKEGGETKMNYEIINIEINTGETMFKAVIAPHYAIQGAPIEAYAEQIVKLYSK